MRVRAEIPCVARQVGFIRVASINFKTKSALGSTNQYHNPLAVEPESAKDAARKITLPIFPGVSLWSM
jgi:hypothetical protein